MSNDPFSESKLDELWKNVKAFRSCELFKAIMEACATFRHLALYNAMLVAMQRPGAKYVLSEYEWRNRYNRGIKPNSRPIIVLIPFGPVDFLFEIGDTYPLESEEPNLFSKGVSDNEILEAIAAPYKTRQDVSDDMLYTLISRLAFHGIALDMDLEAGAGYGAGIEILEQNSPVLRIPVGRDSEIQWPADYLLSVNKNAQNGERYASICHELGHLFCHHLISPKGWKSWKVRNIPHNAQEFEAEAVSWLICERLYISNPSERYLSGYLSENEEIPPAVSVERILYAAKEVWNLCSDTTFKYRDGLLYKNCDSFKGQFKQLKQ